MSIELGTGAKCMRVLFIFFNGLFLIVGLVIMSVGAWLYATGSTLAYVTGNNYANGAAIIIAAGIFTAVLSCLGVFAAACKNRPLLGLFIGILVAIIIVEIVAGILGFVYLADVNSILNDRLQGAINNYGDPKTASVIDDIQKGLKCCGVKSYADYFNNQQPNSSYFCAKCSLPPSCNCTSTVAGACTLFLNNASTACGGSCSNTPTATYSISTTGCVAAWNSDPLAKKVTYTVGGFGIAVGLFEILGVLVGCGLICCITKSKKETLA
eukprot:Em0003g375a